MLALRCVCNLCLLSLLWLATGCSNGRGSLEEQQPQEAEAQGSFSVGGTVSGLVGSGLVLANNGGGDLPIAADGAFTFVGLLTSGATYDVTVRSQPSGPAQTCTVADGSGAIAASNVATVAVTCATNAFALGGTVTGLLGSGLILQNNGGDDLAISANGGFAFAERLANGATYSVGVKAQPSGPTQNCVVHNAAGTIADANVNNVDVSCAADRFTIGGTVTGLLGSGLVLQLNSANDLDVVRDGSFAFSAALPSGAAYAVSVKKQPGSPTQICTVTNAAGVTAAGNVADIAVTCQTTSFSIGGTVSGLTGGGLVLQLNGGDDLAVASNGAFTFATALASRAQYRVTARSQPSDPPQVCTLANAAGTVGGGDVTTVRVTCAVNTFSTGGTVSGLMGSGLVLQNNGDDRLAVDSDGAFTFERQLANAASYNVTVRTQPSNPTQGCTVANGTGTVDGANVTNVSVNCSTSDFTIGGTVSGLTGSSLVLRNNGTDELTVDSDGRFTFATALPIGSAYHVTIAVQPQNPDQVCTLANASGVVATADVSNVSVTCATTGFTVGGRVSHLSGSGLTLQNNGSDRLEIASNGRFRFPTSLASGTPYNITVARQPVDPGQNCEVRDGSGTVRDSDIEDVEVRCRRERDD